MWFKPRKYDFPEFEDNDLTTSGRPSSKLLAGIIIPVVVALDGLYFIVTKKSFTFGLRFPSPEMEGPEVVFWGIALLFAAAFIHFHFYWSVSEKLWKYSGILKIISMVGIVISLGLMFWKGSPFV
ncbi:MAG: hypothetical protein K5787_18045 [Lentisphaeria bacterium]|nr:hypothetical protein [Lentisphaeria bacterium]